MLTLVSDFVILSHRFQLVKHFFKKFLSFFDAFLFSRTACLSYHNSFCLSTSFLSFSNFLNCLCFSFISNASLSYHKLSYLSTTFLTFFKKLLLSNFITFRSFLSKARVILTLKFILVNTYFIFLTIQNL